MNMNALIQQAKKMQKEMLDAQNELEKAEYIGKSQCVEIKIKGSYEIKDIIITDDSILEDKEILSDMLIIAFNDAVGKVKKASENKMGKYANLMPGF